ncbi:MAG: hypothetical protein LBS31_12630 [Candidatus Adiutrix sp.]|jgi:uncharacterized lipoprotein YajG|nr:hypothetical protein [Candidatus Adiutrix sp.]
MKRIFSSLALTLSFVFISACGNKAMEVTYNVRPAAALKNFTVLLQVSDQRHIKDLVGPAAKAQGLFQELGGGRFDLKINMPNGAKITMTGLNVEEAVREAVTRKLQTQGVAVAGQRAQAHLTMEIDIDQMAIDVENGDLTARISLTSRIFRDQTAVSKSQAGAAANRIKLIGGAGGATVLSDALSQAINELDLSGINNF